MGNSVNKEFNKNFIKDLKQEYKNIQKYAEKFDHSMNKNTLSYDSAEYLFGQYYALNMASMYANSLQENEALDRLIDTHLIIICHMLVNLVEKKNIKF